MTTDASGAVAYTLPQGDYRFRADRDGTQFWSASTDDCAIPGCEADSVTVTRPVNVTVAGPCDLPSLIAFLNQIWQDELIFHPGTYRELNAWLEVVERMSDRGRDEQAARLLELFLDRLESALEKERIDPVAAALLWDGGTCIVAELAGHD